VLLRLWVGWQPLWERAIAPAPFDPSLGPLLLALPAGGWLWSLGNRRWPDVFAIGHLLALGGLLALTAAHSEAVWAGFWAAWAGDLPLAAFPFVVICLAPLAGGLGDEATRSWPKALIVPNLLLLGAVSWLVLDRTRTHWITIWETAWGTVPARPDLALTALALPLLGYGWLLATRAWPHGWAWANAALLGACTAWAADRSRAIWLDDWQAFVGDTLNPALLIAPLPLVIVAWRQGRNHWRGGADLVALTWLSLFLAWLASRAIDGAHLLPTTAAALLPVAALGWWKTVRRHPRAGWGFTLLPVLAVAAVASFAPELLADLTAPLLALLLT
ncbi:MAG: hypothetical protein ACRD1H_12065, partial [Vicinamibacterales bacterium]